MPVSPVFRTFRDAELSLWQAAVNQTFEDQPAPSASVMAATAGGAGAILARVNPFLRAAEHVGAAVETIRDLTGRDPVQDVLPDKPVLTAADLPSPSVVLGNFEKFGLLVISLVRKAGPDPNVFMELLKARYSDLDPRWAQAALNYFLFVNFRHQGIPGYRRYAKLDDFVIDGKLPDRARVALVGDWETGSWSRWTTWPLACVR